MGRKCVKEGSEVENIVKIVISDLENLYIPTSKQNNFFEKFSIFVPPKLHKHRKKRQIQIGKSGMNNMCLPLGSSHQQATLPDIQLCVFTAESVLILHRLSLCRPSCFLVTRSLASRWSVEQALPTSIPLTKQNQFSGAHGKFGFEWTPFYHVLVADWLGNGASLVGSILGY